MELIYPKSPYLSEVQRVDPAVTLEIAGLYNLGFDQKIISLCLFPGLQSVPICNCFQMLLPYNYLSLEFQCYEDIMKQDFGQTDSFLLIYKSF